MTTSTERPVLTLSGGDGNVFLLIGKAKLAARKAGWDTSKWNEVQKEAMEGDYDHVLATLMKHFEVE